KVIAAFLATAPDAKSSAEQRRSPGNLVIPVGAGPVGSDNLINRIVKVGNVIIFSFGLKVYGTYVGAGKIAYQKVVRYYRCGACAELRMCKDWSIAVGIGRIDYRIPGPICKV